MMLELQRAAAVREMGELARALLAEGYVVEADRVLDALGERMRAWRAERPADRSRREYAEMPALEGFHGDGGNRTRALIPPSLATKIRGFISPIPPLRAARWVRKHLQTRLIVIKGDAVIYRRDPLLFGVMTVYVAERPDGGVTCALASPEQLAEPLERGRFRVIAFERFDPAELEPAAPPPIPAAPGLIAGRP